MAGFKITNMSFNYGNEELSEAGTVEIRFDARFEGRDNIAGLITLSVDEFNANTDGLVGYANLVKDKLVKNFNEMMEKE